jgi:hypothetical protein
VYIQAERAANPCWQPVWSRLSPLCQHIRRRRFEPKSVIRMIDVKSFPLFIFAFSLSVTPVIPRLPRAFGEFPNVVSRDHAYAKRRMCSTRRRILHIFPKQFIFTRITFETCRVSAKISQRPSRVTYCLEQARAEPLPGNAIHWT